MSRTFKSRLGDVIMMKFLALLGKTVVLELSTGEMIYFKIMAVSKDETIHGIDDEGMNRTIGINKIDTVRIPGSGVINR